MSTFFNVCFSTGGPSPGAAHHLRTHGRPRPRPGPMSQRVQLLCRDRECPRLADRAWRRATSDAARERAIRPLRHRRPRRYATTCFANFLPASQPPDLVESVCVQLKADFLADLAVLGGEGRLEDLGPPERGGAESGGGQEWRGGKRRERRRGGEARAGKGRGSTPEGAPKLVVLARLLALAARVLGRRLGRVVRAHLPRCAEVRRGLLPRSIAEV